MMKYLIPSLVIASALMLSSVTYAGGLFIPLGGVMPGGRAGAVVASARDPNAIQYNPALVALGEGHQLLVDVQYGLLQLEYTRAPETTRNGSLMTFDTVTNEAKGIAMPQVLFTTDFGTDTFGLGVGLFSPISAPLRLPEDGPQRYVIIDYANTIAFTVEAAFAWRPHPRVAIGAGIQNITFVFKGAGVSSTYLGVFGEPNDADLDSEISVNAADYFTPSANFGIWYNPIDCLEIAASFQLFADIQSKSGTFKAALPNHYVYEITELTGSKMDIKISLPWTLRFGLRYVHDDVFDIEIDARYDRWSRQDEIVIMPHDVYLTNNALVDDVKVDDFHIPRNLKDTWGISIGSDWHIIPNRLTLRAGFAYESGAASDENYSVFLYDTHKFIPTIGLSVDIAFVRLDFNFAHVQQISKNITKGTFKQYNLVYPEGAIATNNGKYSTFYDFIGIGANFTFGK